MLIFTDNIYVDLFITYLFLFVKPKCTPQWMELIPRSAKYAYLNLHEINLANNLILNATHSNWIFCKFVQNSIFLFATHWVWCFFKLLLESRSAGAIFCLFSSSLLKSKKVKHRQLFSIIEMAPEWAIQWLGLPFYHLRKSQTNAI